MFEGKSVTDDIALTSTLLKIAASTVPLCFDLDTTPCCQISVWKRLVALFRKFQASELYLFLKKKNQPIQHFMFFIHPKPMRDYFWRSETFISSARVFVSEKFT